MKKVLSIALLVSSAVYAGEHKEPAQAITVETKHTEVTHIAAPANHEQHENIVSKIPTVWWNFTPPTPEQEAQMATDSAKFSYLNVVMCFRSIMNQHLNENPQVKNAFETLKKDIHESIKKFREPFMKSLNIEKYRMDAIIMSSVGAIFWELSNMLNIFAQRPEGSLTKQEIADMQKSFHKALGHTVKIADRVHTHIEEEKHEAEKKAIEAKK